MLHQVFIISDGTGRTAEQALKAALTQYEASEVEIHICPNIRTKSQVTKIVSEVYNIKGLIVHTVVSKKLRDIILEQGRLHDVETIDIMGPLLAQLSHHFSNSPSEEPGIYHELNKSYFQRIEALEYTFRHDDGQKIEELKKAEIVLLGVSRTFKTPVSIYLAHKGWLVANIPIILGIKLPETLFSLPPERVFCLTTYPNRLVQLRKVRDKHLGGATGEYATMPHIKRELSYALNLFRKQPKWSMIDVTNKPIEEISSEILSVLRNSLKDEYKQNHIT
ncbi:MAG: kinase/pyrophosphorylase [Candidatus Marinimicrobia bacterium]|nr:kinase/pyrophosphorylase [Candidatus Neomarinimicrobiota bacterium]